MARPYDVADHVLAGRATERADADAHLAPQVTADRLDEVLAQVPDAWLADEPGFSDVDAVRAAYRDHLLRRVADRTAWQP